MHSARIVGPLDLSWLELSLPLALIDCAFSDPLHAETAAVAGLDLSGSQLPQPRLLLADGPGTGKTVMARIYVRASQRLVIVRPSDSHCAGSRLAADGSVGAQSQWPTQPARESLVDASAE